MCFILWIYTSQLHSRTECWTQPYVVQKCGTWGVRGTHQLWRHEDEQGGRRHLVPTSGVRRRGLLFLCIEVNLNYLWHTHSSNILMLLTFLRPTSSTTPPSFRLMSSFKPFCHTQMQLIHRIINFSYRSIGALTQKKEKKNCGTFAVKTYISPMLVSIKVPLLANITEHCKCMHPSASVYMLK